VAQDNTRGTSPESEFRFYRVSAVIVIMVIGDYFVGKNCKTVSRLVGVMYAARELRSVIRFPNVRNTEPADTHRRIREVYGDTRSDN